MGVVATFSDATTSSVAAFSVRPPSRPLAVFRFSFPTGSSDLAGSAEASLVQQLGILLWTFSTQCGLDVPATRLSVTVVGRQSPAERSAGLASIPSPSCA